MQLILSLSIDAEQYVAAAYHRKIVPPPECPHCRTVAALLSLGYYERNLSRIGPGVLRVTIRRFRCRECGNTVSILPSFAQPYRLVQNITTEQFARGAPYEATVLRWLGILRRYWRRFSRWLPEILKVAVKPSRAARAANASDCWNLLMALYGSFERATQDIVSIFQITFFGRYRCHRPNPPDGKVPL